MNNIEGRLRKAGRIDEIRRIGQPQQSRGRAASSGVDSRARAVTSRLAGRIRFCYLRKVSSQHPRCGNSRDGIRRCVAVAEPVVTAEEKQLVPDDRTTERSA